MVASSPQPSFSAMTVQELDQRLAQDHAHLQLLDVREPQEVEIAFIPGFEVLSLSRFSDLAEQITQRLNLQAETIVLCHHGVRSAQMCQWLAQQGFTNLKNVTGGIDAYSLKVDPSIPRY